MLPSETKFLKNFN